MVRRASVCLAPQARFTAPCYRCRIDSRIQNPEPEAGSDTADGLQETFEHIGHAVHAAEGGPSTGLSKYLDQRPLPTIR